MELENNSRLYDNNLKIKVEIFE